MREVMVSDPIAAVVPGTRKEVLRLFRLHGHAGFPVVKEGSRKLAGVVDRAHLLGSPDEVQTALLMDPNPATTYPEATLHEAARLVVQRQLRTLPVTDGSNDLVGVITPAELLASLPVPLGHLAPHLRRRFVPIHRSTPIGVALEVIRSTRATALPVLDDRGQFHGVLTDADLLSGLVVADGTVGSTAGIASGDDAWAWGAHRDTRQVRHATSELVARPGAVEDLATPRADTLGPNSSLRSAVDLVVERGLHQLPITVDGHVVDLLSEADLLAALVQTPIARDV